MEKWTDETVMPFGKHKGKKLANVPSAWLMWYKEFATNRNPSLITYIDENMMVLMQESDLDKIKRNG